MKKRDRRGLDYALYLPFRYLNWICENPFVKPEDIFVLKRHLQQNKQHLLKQQQQQQDKKWSFTSNWSEINSQMITT